MEKKKIWPLIFVGLLFLNSIIMGVLLGKGLSGTINTINLENFTEDEEPLPTQLLDINGELITEFTSDEKREIIEIKDLPQHMIDALITREDRIFFEHNGFSAKALTRAVVGVITRKSLGGGSTLTQQIAGSLYCDRSDYSIKRKLKELWWALQMERRYSKNEIMELYLNQIYFGGGTYGVNAASKYYFGHPAQEITPAEAAILVIQLSNPAFYNPFDNTNRAQTRQKTVLDAMVENGYLTAEQEEESYEEFWSNFDYSRTNSSVHAMKVDEAPWFSEYVRRNLSDMLYGTDDIYTSGYIVNTTLNLSHQKAAQEVMEKYIAYANRRYQEDIKSHDDKAFKIYEPMTELMSLMFELPSLKTSEKRVALNAKNTYRNKINPIVDVFSMMFGANDLKTGIVNKANTLVKSKQEKTTIEGTMIALENETGYIDALVGGSKFDSENQFIRAIQAKLQPGSTIKPIYYSAAIDHQVLIEGRTATMTTIVSDTPIVFTNEDGTPYIPLNFKGEWEGDVQLWYALAHSMNVVSLKTLHGLGFQEAINRAQKLYGIKSNELVARNFKPGYPFGLGVSSVRPVEVARAFAIIANNGKEVTPISIRTVEDRKGNIIKNPEKEIRDSQKNKDTQVISKETAFIMQEMLKNTVNSGTLRNATQWENSVWVTGMKGKYDSGSKLKFTDEKDNSFVMPAAGKTGTTQNWADAWTAGFTPYYTAVFWFGFDKPGQSLGLKLTGATLAGIAWGDYMHEANDGKPYKTFGEKPESLIEADVCTKSGELWTEACGNHKITAFYFPGTEPLSECSTHSTTSRGTNMQSIALYRLQREKLMSGATFDSSYLENTEPLTVDLSFLNSKTIVDTEKQVNDNLNTTNVKQNKNGDYRNFLLQ